jgi:hypothetical protein
MTTLDTITTNQIHSLRDGAASAGDTAMVDLCNLALCGDQDALADCVEAIQAAEAMDDDKEG